MMFPDVELALMDYLGDLGYTVTATPLDLQEHLPVIRLQRVGGEDDYRQNTDYPLVVVQVYALKSPASPRAARDLSETVRDRMNALNDGGYYVVTENTLLCECQTVVGPVELTYIDPTIAIFTATYRVTTKGR